MVVLEKTQKAITDLIMVFQNNPMELLYECDYQAHLYSNLRKLIKEEIVIRTSKLDPESFKKPGIITTPIVHTEYPSTSKAISIRANNVVVKISRFDVAIIDPLLKQDTYDYIEERTEIRDHLNEGIWCQRVQVAIQLKFRDTYEFKNQYVTTHLYNKMKELRTDVKNLKSTNFITIKKPFHLGGLSRVWLFFSFSHVRQEFRT